MMSSTGKTKNRIFIPIAIAVLVSLTFLYSFCKRSEKNEVIMRWVVQAAEMQHFSPPPINDAFSQKAFAAYLKRLDPYKRYLTKEDIKQMSVYELQIDDQIQNNTFQLYDLAVRLSDSSLVKTQAFYKDILSRPFDFDASEMYELDPDKSDWAANDAELKERWRKEMKYRTMVQLSNLMKAQEKETDQSKIKTPAELEADARQRELKSADNVLRNYIRQKPDSKFAMYVNAVMAVFDPHTIYNTPTDKATFDIRMSGQLEGIGATLQSSDGYVKVVDIVPGSPSYMQGDLKVNDLIVKVKQEHEAEPVDLFGMNIDDAVKLIRGKKGTKVTLTVKRSDGSLRDITITRDVVIVEETYAKSAVLTDPTTNTKVGYIYLPSFYIDFKNTPTGRACSDDVAKEVEKLKKENVQGIVLDLRYNTGGSLGDVIKMAGLFIPSGPVVQVKSNIGPPHVYSDPDPEVQYEGPFAILTSSLSASASEIFAAAMQDYKRAVIIGGPSTFGKGTVQVIADLDDYLPENMANLRPLGSLFLTIQKYYRINGGATQLKGVVSDVVLPDLYSEMKIGERYEDYCLPWTTVDPARGYRVWKDPVPVTMLQKKSKERTAKSEAFKILAEQTAFLKKDDTKVSLNLKAYRADEDKRKQENKRFEAAEKKSTRLNVAGLSVDITALNGDTAKISRTDKWLADLRKDVYLEEAVQVIGDMKSAAKK